MQIRFAKKRILLDIFGIDLFVVEDVFKIEKRKIVSFFKCEEDTETENL